MQQLILVIHVLAAISIVALVLLQYGKGADVGATFGSGGSNTMFGGRGAVPFLMKVTSVLAAVFFATSLGLNFLANDTRTQNSVINLSTPQTMTLPPTKTNKVVPQKKSSTTIKRTVRSKKSRPEK